MSVERCDDPAGRGEVPELLIEAFECGLVPTLLIDITVTPARVLRANDAMRRLTGYSLTPGTVFTEFVEGFDPHTWPGGTVETVVRRPTSELVAVTMRTDRLTSRPGILLVQLEPHGCTGLRAERALWESEQRLEAIADAVSALIYLKDLDGRYLLINSCFEAERGVRREDVAGMSDVDIFGEDRARTYSAHDRQVLAAGHSMQFEELMPDGRTFVSTKFPLRRQDGEIYAVGGISTDISVRTETERAMRAAKEAAERANQTKSEFLSRTSHELRTPLNSILGFGQLLQLDLAGDVERREHADRIVQAGQHLLTLINDVLDLSRIEQHERELEVGPVRAVEVFQDALVMLRPLAQARRIEIARDFHDGLHTWVLANAQGLTQVLLNILSNAVKYNREGGMVTASFGSVADRRIRFLVTDTGFGIDAADLERIFAPFERLGAETSDVEGTGLGLALSKSIAEAMGGTVGVARTKKGRGSVFYVELPVTADAPATDPRSTAAVAPDPVPLQGTLRGIRVLYIEDDPANVALVQQVVGRRALADLVCAPTGRAGIDTARHHLPDVILLDMHLPEMQGEDVLAALRNEEQTRNVPVIALSADAVPDRIARLVAAGAAAYLTKPLDVYRLVETIRAVTGQAHS
ncbi:PAS domain-containing hybrid sensor histidine kinase/response regulator [Rhodococcus koreensis]